MEVKTSAPGKVILHGEHAVVYGKKSIAVSVGLNTFVEVTKLEKCVKLVFKAVGINTELSIEALEKLQQDISAIQNFKFEKLNSESPISLNPSVVTLLEDFVSGDSLVASNSLVLDAAKSAFQAFLFLFLSMFDEIRPFHILITTELPVGAGLGSSASFGVALAGALLISSGRMEKENVDLDMVNRWAYVSECFVHGNPSGVDNSVATFGGAVLFQKGSPLVHLNCSGIKVLLVDTNIPRSTKNMVKKSQLLREEDEELHENLMSQMNDVAESAVHELKKTGQTTSNLVERNQELLSKLGVSHPQIDAIVAIAKNHGLRGKLTGAGGGGCVYIYLPVELPEETEKSLIQSLHDSKFEKTWSIVLGDKGFSVLS